MKKQTENDEFNDLIQEMKHLSFLLEQAENSLAESTGQSAARWKVLASLADESKTVSDIARDLNVSRQAVQRLADALTKDKLTNYSRNPKDRRADLLDLTPRGRAILMTIQSGQKIWSLQKGNKLGSDKIKKITKSMNQLAEILS